MSCSTIEQRAFDVAGHGSVGYPETVRDQPLNRNDDRAMLSEPTTGKRPGGPVRLHRRPLDEEEWADAGEVVEAVD